MGPTDRAVGEDHREEGTAEHVPYVVRGPGRAGNGRGAHWPVSPGTETPRSKTLDLFENQ